MPKNLKLYNHHRKPIGIATWNKRNATVDVSYDNKIHYPDTTLQFDEFDEYKRLRGILDERDMNQLTLEDLI